MIIRPIQPADRDEWLRLRRALWPSYPLQQLIDEIEPYFTTQRIWSLPSAVFVHDRGSGFDRAAVPDDRHGLAESIEGRMQRAGGEAVVTSTPGEGTEVELRLPR